MKGDFSKKRGRWLLLVLGVIGLVLSAWLSWRKLMGEVTSLAGCGAGSGCENVLGGRWSVFAGVVPVSLFSMMVYGGVIFGCFGAEGVRRLVLRFCGWSLIFGALWFVGLQVFVVGDLCIYCVGMHLLGVCAAGMIFWSLGWKCDVCLGGALVGVVVLAMGQVFGPVPDSHLLTAGSEVKGDLSGGENVEGRVIEFLDGRKKLAIGEAPLLGDGRAEDVILEYVDYTCAACKTMNGHMKELMERRGGGLAVMVLPVPLNPDCNPHMAMRMKEHANACFLAHFAITVWSLDSAQFSEYHSWLFEHFGCSVDEAKKEAERLVGAKSFEAGLRSKKVKELMMSNVADYGVLSKSNPVMPKVLVGAGMISGRAVDADALQETLSGVLGW